MPSKEVCPFEDARASDSRDLSLLKVSLIVFGRHTMEALNVQWQILAYSTVGLHGNVSSIGVLATFRQLVEYEPGPIRHFLVDLL